MPFLVATDHRSSSDSKHVTNKNGGGGGGPFLTFKRKAVSQSIDEKNHKGNWKVPFRPPALQGFPRYFSAQKNLAECFSRHAVPTYLLHESPEPLDELRLVVAVAPGVAVEGRRGDHEAGRPVPHEGHRVALDHADEVRDVLGAPLHAHVVHQALQRRQPHVDELACQVETRGGKVTITVMNILLKTDNF